MESKGFTMHKLFKIMMVAVLLAVASLLGGASWHDAYAAGINTSIKPDKSATPIRSVDGYTVTLTNTTSHDVTTVTTVQLPGHGVNPIPADIFGEPTWGDLTTNFAYAGDSTIGDPVENARSLEFPAITVAAASSRSFHFNVTVSKNQAYYQAGVTVDYPDHLGVWRGAQILVTPDENFDIWSTADRSCVAPGGSAFITTYVKNKTNTRQTLTWINFGVTSGISYVAGTSRGVYSFDPAAVTKRTTKYTWLGGVSLAPGETVSVTFKLRYDLNASGGVGVRSAAGIAGWPTLGQGPQAKVKVNAGCV